MSRVVIGQSVDLLHHQSVKISISQSPCLSVSKVTFNQPINLSVFRGLSLSKSNNLKRYYASGSVEPVNSVTH